MVAFVEGAMAIGEHLGILMQAFWTLFMAAAILKEKLFSNVVAVPGMIIGALTILVALEPLGSIFSTFGELTNPVVSAWYIWLIYLAVSLLKSQPKDESAPKFGYTSLAVSTVA